MNVISLETSIKKRFGAVGIMSRLQHHLPISFGCYYSNLRKIMVFHRVFISINEEKWKSAKYAFLKKISRI